MPPGSFRASAPFSRTAHAPRFTGITEFLTREHSFDDLSSEVKNSSPHGRMPRKKGMKKRHGNSMAFVAAPGPLRALSCRGGPSFMRERRALQKT